MAVKMAKEPFKTLSRCKEAEEYFYKKDRALIRQLRETADRKRREQEVQQRKAWHWMKCPKCGSALQETDRGCVKVDRCGECHGIFFDDGELEIFTRMLKKTDFLTRLSKRWEEKLAHEKFNLP